jgi:hypothetical protein
MPGLALALGLGTQPRKVGAPAGSGGYELREDNSKELREDGGKELREPD